MSRAMRKEMVLTKYDFGLESYFPIREEQDGQGTSYGVYVAKTLEEHLETPIYRYMDFTYLVNLIKQKELFFPNRQRFTDLREHSDNYFKSWDEAKNIMSIIPSYRNRKYRREEEERHAQIWNQAVSCWTYDAHREDNQHKMLEENYLMWKCHANKRFVCRIRSSIQRFSQSLNNISHDILISDIDYVAIPHFHLKDTPSEIFKKPNFYIDEQEIRFVALQKNKSECIAEKAIQLPVIPTMLIEEITLSPFICREEEVILKERLLAIMGESPIRIKPSMLMEFY